MGDNNDDHKYGFIVMDGTRTLFGTLSGNTREVLFHCPIYHPTYGRGQSSWYEHIRMETHINYLRKTAELATHYYINHSTSQPNVSGLILAVSPNLNTEFSSNTRMFDPRLQILNVVEVSCGGEDGFNQAIELSAEIFWNLNQPALAIGGISTVHAILISVMALYFVFFSDLFSDQRNLQGLMVFRCSPLSNFGLGVSVSHFLADLGMIFWLYPSLGGSEYIVHHCLSGTAVAYSLFSGEAQLYTYMVLISKVTTPEINLRWYLDIAGLKRSKTYLINGVAIFLAWLTARILLFVYMFYHVYTHYDQVVQMHTVGYLLVSLYRLH